MGLPSSHSLRLIPCYGLRPRWTHITSQCPRTPCYIPRPEDWTNGGVNAAFRHTDNVGFQNHQNFGAYNLHLSIVAWYPLPPASHQPVTRMGAGFGSEVVANLSSGWIFTSWRVWIYLGTPDGFCGSQNTPKEVTFHSLQFTAKSQRRKRRPRFSAYARELPLVTTKNVRTRNN